MSRQSRQQLKDSLEDVIITPAMKLNPWFFYDETGAPVGPYKTEEQAERQSILYGKHLDGTITPEEKDEVAKCGQECFDLFQELKRYFDAFSIDKKIKTIFSGYYFLSFVDTSDPSAHKSLGACIVAGSSMEEAVIAAHTKKINPGGEVLAMPIPLVPGNKQYELHIKYVDEFMTMEQLQERGFKVKKLKDVETLPTN